MDKDKKSEQESPKSRLVLLLLCFFLGWFGGHHFYANKVSTGFLMMFTMGGFGMWYFADLVMVSLGVFKDKEGLPISNWY